MDEDCITENRIMDDNSEVSHRNTHGVERRLVAVERDVAVMRSNYATKEDLVKLESKMHERLAGIDRHVGDSENRLVRWIFGTFVALAAMAFSAGKYL